MWEDREAVTPSFQMSPPEEVEQEGDGAPPAKIPGGSEGEGV